MTRLQKAFVRIDRSLTWRLSRGLFGRICRASVELHPYVHGDPSRVRVADTAVINNALLNCSSGTITIGQYAMVAHGVQILTGTHDYKKTGVERQWSVPASGRDIVIDDGAWIASGAIVLGPCTIGRNAVVAAGSVVQGDVPDGTMVGGVPARILT